MGLIGKILAAKLVAKLTERLDRAQTDPVPKAEYIPAGRAAPVGARGNVLLDRAGRIYQRNPKLVATVGAAALALIAAGLSRRRRF
jgi:putative intracellular protease/amidase